MTLALLLRDAPAGGGSSVTLAGTLTATSALAGALTLAIPLAVTEAGTSTLTGDVSVSHPLAAAPAGSSTMTGALDVPKLLSGIDTGASTMTGLARGTYALAGTDAGSSAMTGALFFGLSGQMLATSTMTGAMSLAFVLGGTMEGDSVTGDPGSPSTGLYPNVTVFPGVSSARLKLVYALVGTDAGSATLRGGYTDLAGVMAGASAMGYPRAPSTTTYPSTGLYPGILGGVLTVGTHIDLAGTMASSSSMTGLAAVGGASAGDPVNITITFGRVVMVSLTIDPEVETGVFNKASVLIGVADG